MDRDTCLLCFSINVKTFNIKETPLQDVYEEITGFKAQTDPHRLCYICYAKLQQCYSLVILTRNIKMSSENENRQVEYPPLVELSKVLNTSTPYHFVATKQEPDVKEDSSYCETGVETMVQPVSIKVEPEVLDTKSDSQLTNEKMKISKRYCSVFGCLNNGCKDSGLSFFCVPTDQRTTAYNRTMGKKPDEPEDVTNKPLPSMSEPMKVQDAVASTLATPFAQPIIAASKSKAQKQRDYNGYV